MDWVSAGVVNGLHLKCNGASLAGSNPVSPGGWLFCQMCWLRPGIVSLPVLSPECSGGDGGLAERPAYCQLAWEYAALRRPQSVVAVTGGLAKQLDTLRL